MPGGSIVFDGVWKKFRRGERHDSLRDLIPSLFKRTPPDELAQEEFWVLRDVSFEVRDGETLGIIGPNGAGKSTVLKLLTRILRPTKGTAHVQGRIGALIEVAAGFHPDLTGRENVFLQGAILGMNQEIIRRRFDAIVDFAGIADFIDTPIKRYSSGMNARLGFAIAANLEPDVLLLDEVLAVGDFSFQQKCYQRLREFRQQGVPIAFVSHNMQAIASLCDRVLLLRPQMPPILTTVSEALAAYSATGDTTVDPRVRLSSGTLTTGGASGQAVTALRPGAPLSVTVAFEVNEPLPRCCVCLEVVRTDGVVVFAGSPMFDREPTVDLLPGTVLQVKFDFRAHLSRGTYAVNIHLVDEQRTWRPVVLPRVGSFGVHETNRVGGFAELEPVYESSIASAQGVQSPAAIS